jgi:hypothetical protein
MIYLSHEIENEDQKDFREIKDLLRNGLKDKHRTREASSFSQMISFLFPIAKSRTDWQDHLSWRTELPYTGSLTMKFACGFFTLALISTSAFAGPDCTKEPKEKWKNDKSFQEDLTKTGYKIKNFKVTDGNCYEVYGWDKEGNKVEIYFNPVTGEKVKEEIKKK